MAKQKRRGISCGTVIMILVTLATVGMCLWLIPRFFGSFGEASRDSGVLLHVITGEEGKVQLESTPEPTPVASAEVTATPQPVATATPIPKTMTVRAVGSLHAENNIRQSAYDEVAESYIFRDIFAPVQSLLSDADLTLATLETTISGKEAGYGDYNAPSQYLDALQQAGVDILSLATERALEYGAEGLQHTILQAEGKGFLLAGVQHTPNGQVPPRTFQVGGIQVAVVGYTFALSRQSQRLTEPADRTMVAVTDMDTVTAQIAAARKEGAHLIIVMMHWGERNNIKLTQDQKTQAQQLAQAGADVVLGAHSGMLQPIEMLPRDDGGQTLVAYSLGAFLNDDRTLANGSAVILGFTVKLEPDAKRVTLEDVFYTPTWVDRTRSDGKYHYRILRSADEEAKATQNGQTNRQLENSLLTVEKVITENEFLTMRP